MQTKSSEQNDVGRELPPPKPLSKQDADGLRSLLDGHGFNQSSVDELVALPGRGLDSTAVEFLDSCTQKPTPLNVLQRLFTLDLPVPLQTVRFTLGDTFLALGSDSGLLLCDGETALAGAGITPFDGLYIAGDPRRVIQSSCCPTKVLGITGSTRVLYGLTPRRPFTRMLDLFAGGGVHAISASRHCEETIGVDISPRCAAFAQFNATLNQRSNSSCVVGDAVRYVDEDGFDLIVANPPFFISPNCDNLYCENPMGLDGYASTMVSRCNRLLRDEGVSLLLCDWIETPNCDWKSRMTKWLAGTNCNALVLLDSAMMPEAYAFRRVKFTTRHPGLKAADLCSQWLQYYRENEIVKLFCGVIILEKRRDTRPGWVRYGDFRAVPGADRYVWAWLEGIGSAESLATAEDVLECPLALRPEIKVYRELRGAADFSKGLVELRAPGSSSKVLLQRDIGEIVLSIPKSGNLRRALASVIGNSDSQIIIDECVSGVRDLIERGFLRRTHEMQGDPQ